MVEPFLVRVKNKETMEKFADALFGPQPGKGTLLADLKRDMLAAPTAFVHMRHFPLPAFSFGETGRRCILEGYTPELQAVLDDDEVKNLKERVDALRTGSVAVVSNLGYLMCVARETAFARKIFARPVSRFSQATRKLQRSGLRRSVLEVREQSLKR